LRIKEDAMSKDRLEQALEAMRAETVDASEMAAARARVWAKLIEGSADLCGGFRQDLGAYAEGRLKADRRLLVEDHLARCPECRRAFGALRGTRNVTEMPVRQRGWVRRSAPWAMAAGVALVALYTGRGSIDNALAPRGPRGSVEVASGEVRLLSGAALAPGAKLGENDVLRTGGGARAVLRLADGSRVEVNERSELALHAAWSGQTVRLTRGDIIVEAAKQRRGRLRVETLDSVASVKGTVFAVSTGVAGSVVSVMEGAVEVSQPTGTKLVRKGQKSASNNTLDGVTLRQTVEWSPDKRKYLELSGDFEAIGRQLAALPDQPLRTEARLVDLLPRGVTFYAASPNLSATLEQALELAGKRSGESATFHAWWESAQARQMREVAGMLNEIAPRLGNEMVFALARHGKDEVPVMLAEVRPGAQAELEKSLTKIMARKPGGAYRLTEQSLIFSDSRAHLDWIVAQNGGGAAEPLLQDVSRQYKLKGAAWLVALDAQGAGGARNVLLEQAGNENSATVNFTGARTGPASWLAPASASGAMEYLSAEAALAMTASMRQPRQIYDELIGQLGKFGPSFKLNTEKLGFDPGTELASAIGTDFAVAIEQPKIPVPGWLATVEVTDATKIDATIERLVKHYNQGLGEKEQNRRLGFSEETVNGRVWKSVTTPIYGVQAVWTYHRGYFVCAATRALAERAIATREGGFQLVRSAAFSTRMPASTGLHPSGFVWVNMQNGLTDVLKMLPFPALKPLIGQHEPLLVVVSGEKERIRVASRTRLASLVLDALWTRAEPTGAKPTHERRGH
jgi:ferric-dicitrate binding protein FerR (iron transport regulator)